MKTKEKEKCYVSSKMYLKEMRLLCIMICIVSAIFQSHHTEDSHRKNTKAIQHPTIFARQNAMTERP